MTDLKGMKAVLLAGGLGTRLSEETLLRPKPMVEIGGQPILWHLIKIYSCHGINDFVICAGYKGYMIKEYFANYVLHTSDATIDIGKNHIECHRKASEQWRITIVDTGQDTMTGGRLKRARPYIGENTFLMTYGDGLADIDVSASIKFHRAHGRYATVTATHPLGRFGALMIANDTEVRTFTEKSVGNDNWINGGFFVLQPEVFKYIADDQTAWEKEPLENLARDEQLRAFKHHGFWHPMDTLRDKNVLEDLWATGKAAWKIWG
jgi:glucose-1-phosphate cytidylyltransferase